MSENLEKFDHIVVLMLENRSFDHMLGYLSLEEGRADIDGLTDGEANEYDGQSYPSFHLDTTRFGGDPKHEFEDVAEQLSDTNGGFVRNFKTNFPDLETGLVMGYYNKDDLPVYHYLANEYLICDRWFCSVPGATSPNRAYALSGTTMGQTKNPGLPNLPPYYAFSTIFDRLDASGVAWRCYSHDIAWLRIYEQHITNLVNIQKIGRFIRDARNGTLPPVSWIEPNYEAFGIPWFANDDHPTSDVRRGQKLVLKVYKAILNSPLRDRILFVITYDEHGGFFDHVPPPAAEDDWPALRRYGVRVPAIVVSPFVPRSGVSSTIFDHTSIIKTILLKYCANSNGVVADWMSTRVEHANHLGLLLTEPASRPKPVEPPPFALAALPPISTLPQVEVEVNQWNLEAEPAPAGMERTELQDMMQSLADAAKARGVPEEQL